MGNLQQTGRAIVRLLRWDKPAGRLILLIPALWALVLASDGRPHPLLVLLVVVGTITTSAAGCVVNDLWDRNIDPKVERTKQRPLAARSLSVKVGVGVMLVAALCAAGLLPFLNGLSVLLSVAAVPVIALYPAAKRVFPVPQLVLAIAWGFAVLIPWSAAIDPPSLDLPAWLLWGAVVLWTLGFDTVYALADREDDRRLGIHSSALFFGDLAPQAIGAFYAGTALLLAYTALALELNIGFWLTLFGAIGLWVQQYLRLSDRQLSRAAYGKMFAENVTIGFVLLAGMLVGCWF
ncbi:MAG: 4-hydroxybenzoate solanesyltransferase [Limnothrix sp.]|uniref:4-hydroxybenzoate solanesyltransferase n=1 Tax=unclassified Limnothrix TaxID=2632864 RepID=UPI0016890782|nr:MULTISPECIES: 4-hydroxybenzoate solanesyltransferase [unclassified Limnothrix]MBD2555096.1 4-hydroxybenzoate solanesyltransferase [Limnothrix sp. FACHB-708]MBD2592534.1 4-hydroxybenzoate solanesyltransferase [Limnothrix sp. FACHB-406]MEB3118085.1 4-hydroxybenzoate solanesyltransferase [Limnothrix sp.]